MLQSCRSLAIGLLAPAMLAACGFNSYGKASGSDSATSAVTGTAASGGASGTGGLSGGDNGIDGTHDHIIVTVQQPLSVEVGSKVTVPVTFTSSDGKKITGFAVSNAAGWTLPSGWAGPATFGCQAVSTGSGCVLNMTFQPTAYAFDQSVAMGYVFVDNSGEPVTDGALSFTYSATTDDNVVPTQTPIGQITAMVNGGTAPLSISFVTDDGYPATNFMITNAANLPSGFTVASTQTSCAAFSGQSPCVISWSYAPTAPASGTLTIEYSFNDDSGTLKTGSYPVAYAAIDHNTIVYSPSPLPAVVGVTGTPRTLTLTFATDDGYPATNLSLSASSLAALPGDWSAAPLPAACASVTTPGACQLSLTYTPSAPTATTTLQLTYTYTDNAGAPESGAINISFSST